MSSLSIGRQEKALCLRGEALNLLTLVSIFWYFSLWYFISYDCTSLSEFSLIKTVLWLTKIDVIPKREWVLFSSISVGCQLTLSSVQHCSTRVLVWCVVIAFCSCSSLSTATEWYQDSENWGHGVHLNDALSDFHYCTPVRGKEVSCLGTSHKHLGWGTWKVLSGCNFEMPCHHWDAKPTVSSSSRFHIIGNFTKALGAAPWVVNR